MSRITFQKRQKEMKRQEKQQRKAERRAERKLAKNAEDRGALGEAPASVSGPPSTPVHAVEVTSTPSPER